MHTSYLINAKKYRGYNIFIILNHPIYLSVSHYLKEIRSKNKNKKTLKNKERIHFLDVKTWKNI